VLSAEGLAEIDAITTNTQYRHRPACCSGDPFFPLVNSQMGYPDRSREMLATG
jgi:hypothetical protein